MITIYINGMKTQVEQVDTISYEKLCALAIQPAMYNPSIVYSLGPKGPNGGLHHGDEAPLKEGAEYNVMITGSA